MSKQTVSPSSHDAARMRIGEARNLPSGAVEPLVEQGTTRSHWAHLRHRVLFFVAVPVLLSFPQGWNQAGPGFSLPAALTWWAVSWLVFWWVAEGSSQLVARALRPWQPPLWLIASGGGLISAIGSRWYHPWMFDLLRPFHQAGQADSYSIFARDLLDVEYLLSLLTVTLPAIVFWVVANYLYVRLAHVERFGIAQQSAPPARTASAAPSASSASDDVLPAQTPIAPQVTNVDATPRFFARMVKFPELRIDELLAVEAEDHYITIHTVHGSELVYYRFTDAVADLAAFGGVQVHRSFWVRKSAIRHVLQSGRSLRAVLANGLEVPVSSANRGLMISLGVPLRS